MHTVLDSYPHPTLRSGDKVTATGTVFADKIEWDEVKVTAPALAIGDQVSWHDTHSALKHYGEVVGINSDDEKQVYVWLKERGKWPRLTKLASELTRLKEPGL